MRYLSSALSSSLAALSGIASLALAPSALAQEESTGSGPTLPEVSVEKLEGESGPDAPVARERQSDRAELDRIIELYMAGRYRECSSELGAFLDLEGDAPFSDVEIVERGRLYFATCGLLLGKRDEAKAALLEALRANPLMQSPDSLTFPPPVVSLFLEVRDEVQQLIADREKEQVVRLRRENERARRQAEARRRREQELEQMAREELIIARNSRWIASVPFGAGQFQNGNRDLGTLFLVSEGLLAGTALTSALILEDLTSSAAKTDGRGPDADAHNARTAAAYSVMLWSSWAFLGVSLVGIGEAHWNFKKEQKVEVRERALPPLPRIEGDDSISETTTSSRIQLTPLVGASPLGGFVGLSGRF